MTDIFSGAIIQESHNSLNLSNKSVNLIRAPSNSIPMATNDCNQDYVESLHGEHHLQDLDDGLCPLHELLLLKRNVPPLVS